MAWCGDGNSRFCRIKSSDSPILTARGTRSSTRVAISARIPATPAAGRDGGVLLLEQGGGGPLLVPACLRTSESQRCKSPRGRVFEVQASVGCVAGTFLFLVSFCELRVVRLRQVQTPRRCSALLRHAERGVRHAQQSLPESRHPDIRCRGKARLAADRSCNHLSVNRRKRR
jgi:hypothetical protein